MMKTRIFHKSANKLSSLRNWTNRGVHSPMIEPESGSPVWRLQQRLERTGHVDKTIAHEEKPASQGR